MAEKYWLSKEPKEVVSKLSEYHDIWSQSGNHPISASWYRNTLAYYATVLDISSLEHAFKFMGEQGELIKMVVPQAKSLCEQLTTLVTKSKLAFKTTAMARGGEVMKATRLGDALSAHVIEEQRLDVENANLVEAALILGAAFTYTRWRTDRGRFTAVDDSESLLYDGECDISIKMPWEVTYDYSLSKWGDLSWCEVRSKMNRYDLIAQFPELEEAILRVPSIKEGLSSQTLYNAVIQNEDMIYVYEFYAKPSPATPMGRMMFYSDDSTIYAEGINRYQVIPVEPMMPKKIQGTLLGYPFLSDLLPAQQMLDHSFSAIATNQSANAVQNVLIPNGSNLNVEDINGMNWVSYTPQNVPGGGKPEALQLTQSAPETFKFIDILLRHMEQVSQISAALRGEPPPGVTSGTAIATLHASSLEFITGTFKAYKGCMEATMMHAVNAYRKFAKVERLIPLTGQRNQTLIKEFKGQDLNSITTMRLPLANPLLQTIGGRIDVAEKLIQNRLVTSVQDYISIIEGAPIQQLYENELSENDRIQEENEMLTQGEKPLTIMTDDHPMHIRKHKALLDDRANREEGENAEGILAHMMEHYQMFKQQDPLLAMIVKTGQGPMGVPQQGGGEGGPPPGASPATQPTAEVNNIGPGMATPAADQVGGR